MRRADPRKAEARARSNDFTDTLSCRVSVHPSTVEMEARASRPTEHGLVMAWKRDPDENSGIAAISKF